MGDPRNVAHAKKVSQEKAHKGKTQPVKKSQPAAEERAPVQTADAAKPEQKPDAVKLEKSLATLAKLRELEFHSRGNIEKLAELSLTIEDELKQKPFAEPIGALYSAQDVFQSKVVALIAAYEAECERLKTTG